jgi:hypothetical protein
MPLNFHQNSQNNYFLIRKRSSIPEIKLTAADLPWINPKPINHPSPVFSPPSADYA